MSRESFPSHGGRISICSIAVLLALGALMTSEAVFAATSNDPLNPRPDLTDELIYYYDYSAVPITTPINGDPGAVFPFDLLTSDQRIIEDRSPNGHHLINFDSDGLLPEEIDQDFLFTDISGESFSLPGTRGFDTFNGLGGVTHDTNPMTHQGISDFGGYTFESFFKRTDVAPGIFNLWNPEGMHSIEMRPSTLLFPPRPVDGDPNGNMHLQFALRSISNFAIDVDDILPLDEWVHLMAVLTVTQPLPPAGNPITDELFAGYELFVNGESLVYVDDKGTPLDPLDDQANPLEPADLNLDPGAGGPFSTIEKENRHHGIGTQEFGSPEGSSREFPGELAMTRLTYGVLTPAQSLCDCVAADNADFNGDDFVDGADFLIWQIGAGVGATAAEGDANGNGVIDGDDLVIWETQYGGPPPLAAAVGAVPEPASLLLLLVGVAGLLGRRHSSRN